VWCILSNLVCLTERVNVPALRQCPSTANACKFEWFSIFMHWNIGQYGVLMNSISGTLPKCWVELSSSCHNSTSSTSVWANGSLDLYPTSRRPGMRTCILYLIFNQYYQKSSLIPWSIKLMCSITLHRSLWEHLVNKRAGQGTHLSKGSSTTLRMVVDVTQITPRLCEMRKCL
jgi:hypothetical protein